MNFGLGPLSPGGGLSLMRVLSSISRTLGVVRQMAPLYNDIKPIISKAPEFLAKIGGMRSNVQNLRENIATVGNVQNYIESPSNSSGGPVFFQ